MTMHLAVAYRGAAYPLTVDPQSSLASLKDQLESLTNVPSSLQKLLFKGKKPSPPDIDESAVTVQSTGLKDGSKITLMGSTSEELDGLREAEAESQRREAILRRRQAAGPSKLSSTSRFSSSSPSLQFRFHAIAPLPHLPNPASAQTLLDKLAADPAIQHIMRKHRFSVGLLTELAPHEHPELLGLNQNAGEIIKLRLRTDAYDGMRVYKEVRRVLCHELTHNVFGDHDDNFKTLNSTLNHEVDEFERSVKAGSRTIAAVGDSGDYYEPEPIGSTLSTGEYHSHVLGGTLGATSSLLGSREEMRARALDAAMDRRRKQEQEIEDRCGSDGPAALK